MSRGNTRSSSPETRRTESIFGHVRTSPFATPRLLSHVSRPLANLRDSSSHHHRYCEYARLSSLQSAHRRRAAHGAESRITNGTSSIAAPRGPGDGVSPLSGSSPTVFVKRGDPRPASEARTQAYLFEQARSHGRAPSLPRVDGVFYDGAGSTYLVMEHVAASSFRAWVDEPGLSPTGREIRTTTAVAAIANTIALLPGVPHSGRGRDRPRGRGMHPAHLLRYGGGPSPVYQCRRLGEIRVSPRSLATTRLTLFL